MTRHADERPEPSPRLADCRAYAPPRLTVPIDLRLDGNEGLVPPGDLLQTLVPALPEVLRRYPSAAHLETALAERFGLSPDEVLVTAGADDALYRTCLATLGRGRTMVLPVPTFEMLPRYGRLAEADVVTVPWPTGAYPLDAVLERLDARTALVVVVSPNNPTGAVATARDLCRLAAAAPRAVLLVDLAYTEFADEDLTSIALALPNALITRTFSKAWGLAGLRVGYALGPAELIGWLRVTGNPYAVAGPSLALAAAWLERGGEQVTAFVQAIRGRRAALMMELTRLGAIPFSSQANFVLVRFARAHAVWDALARQGIAVRAFPDRPELSDCLRITCPADSATYDRLVAALRTALTGRAGQAGSIPE